MNTLVTSSPALRLHITPRSCARSVSRAAATVRHPKRATNFSVVASSSPTLGNNGAGNANNNDDDDDKRRGSRASGLSASRNQQAAAAASSSGIEVIPGDYRIGGVLLSVAAFLGPVCHLWTQFGVHGILGAFLAFQASRVRFRFSDTDLDVVFIEPGADDSAAAEAGTESSGDNKLQGGGQNKWSFESVQNWEFWFPGFPVLVYYKENQTRPEGQPHFFPIIMDGKKLYEAMLAKMPPSVNPKPDPKDWNLDTAFEATPVGRQIKENLSDEQLASLKKTTGFPILDDKK